MRAARLLSVAVFVVIVNLPAAADPLELFDPIQTGPYVSYEANWGTSQDPSWLYSLIFQTTGPYTMGMGLIPGSASVTRYVPTSGDPGPVGEFYDPVQPGLSTDLFIAGLRLVDDAATTVVLDGTTWVVADFAYQVGAQVAVGDPYSDVFSLHGTLPTDLSAAMRIWGQQGASAGRMQIIFELDQTGHFPSEPASESGMTLPALTRVYLDGTVALGSFLDDQQQEQQWVFHTSLFEQDFGAHSEGRIALGQVVPEPATGLLAALGLAGLAARRRRRGGASPNR